MVERSPRPAKRCRDHREAGVAAIEFALLGPLLIILLAGVVELGFAMYQAMQVYNAVEGGVVYAMRKGWDAAGISSAVVNASTVTGMTATPAPVQFCGCPTAGGIVEMACTDPLPTCAVGEPAGVYVRVSATLPHQTILAFPSFGLPTTLQARSIIRLN